MKIPDIQRSIADGRLRENNRSKAFSSWHFIKFIYVAVVLFIGSLPWWYPQTDEQIYPIRPYLPGISFIIAFLIVLRIFSVNKLKHISGKSLGENKKLIKAISEEFNWPFYQNREDYCILHIARTSISWERDVLIIYDRDDILVNITTYAKFRRQSLQGHFGERRAFKKLRKEFE